MSYFRNQLENWLKKIDINVDSVLDVGGLANPVKDRVNSWKVKEYKILDNGAESFNTPDYFVDINNVCDIKKSFDVVFCLEVFEYVWNPLQAMENILGFLNPNGIAYISYPTIYPFHNPSEIDFLRYTTSGVQKLLKKSGFQTWEITPRVATAGREVLGSFYSLEGMHPAKGTPAIYDIGYCVKAWKE